jgi:hypothetical protein
VEAVQQKVAADLQVRKQNIQGVLGLQGGLVSGVDLVVLAIFWRVIAIQTTIRSGYYTARHLFL